MDFNHASGVAGDARVSVVADAGVGEFHVAEEPTCLRLPSRSLVNQRFQRCKMALMAGESVVKNKPNGSFLSIGRLSLNRQDISRGVNGAGPRRRLHHRFPRPTHTVFIFLIGHFGSGYVLFVHSVAKSSSTDAKSPVLQLLEHSSAVRLDSYPQSRCGCARRRFVSTLFGHFLERWKHSCLNASSASTLRSKTRPFPHSPQLLDVKLFSKFVAQR